jgi:hypothetical protein
MASSSQVAGVDRHAEVASKRVGNLFGLIETSLALPPC